jgi:mRNA interferase MazF
MEKIINRGDLYYANLNDQVIGSEQAGIRPVVILQNNIGNYYSSTIIIAPITSRIIVKSKLPTHVTLKPTKNRLPKKSIILTEQVRVIDKTRLKYYIGTLDIAELKAVDKALIIALGIGKIRNNEIKINEKALEKEEKTEFITRKQIASYGIIAKEYLKNTGNLEINNKLFSDYMLTLIDLFNPEEIEKQADKYINS